jgi:hypothetical protein
VRRLSVWLLAAPLMLAGTQAAHAVAYRLVYPEAALRWHELALTGHGYLGYATPAIGVVAAMQLLGFAAVAADTFRGRRPRPLPAWAFALLPPLAYALQELTERFVHGSSDVWRAVQEPTFRVGLVLQLPFALAAWLLARLLLRAARSVGRLLASLRVRRAPSVAPAATGVAHALHSLLHLAGTPTRGPPVHGST